MIKRGRMKKRGALELSIGTLVIIVIAMTMLILGLVLVRTIFSGAVSSVKEIDENVKKEINRIFTEDEQRRIVVYPSTRLIKLKQGSSGEGFAFAIRSLDVTDNKFTYTVIINDNDLRKKCNINEATAESWIEVGASGTIILASGNSNKDNPVFVRFRIPSTTRLCIMRFSILVKNGGDVYTSSDVDLEVKPE